MNENERLDYLETKIKQLEQQLRVIGNELATTKEQLKSVEVEIAVLKEGGNL